MIFKYFTNATKVLADENITLQLVLVDGKNVEETSLLFLHLTSKILYVADRVARELNVFRHILENVCRKSPYVPNVHKCNKN
jgi:hypothetical protein